MIHGTGEAAQGLGAVDSQAAPSGSVLGQRVGGCALCGSLGPAGSQPQAAFHSKQNHGESGPWGLGWGSLLLLEGTPKGLCVRTATFQSVTLTPFRGHGCTYREVSEL